MTNEFYVTNTFVGSSATDAEIFKKNRAAMAMALDHLDLISNDRESSFQIFDTNWLTNKTRFGGIHESKYKEFINLLLEEKEKDHDIISHPYISIFNQITGKEVEKRGDRFRIYAETPWQDQCFDLNKYIDFLTIRNQYGKLEFKKGILNPISKNEPHYLAAATAYGKLIDSVKNYDLTKIPTRNK